MKRYVFFAAVAAVAVGLYFAVMRTAAAPEVTFISIQGEKIATSALRGKVAIVDFWATDCGPCREAMPELVQTYQRYRGRGLELIAVAMRHDPPNYVIQYAERHRLPFKVVLDPMGELARAFGNVEVTPTLVVIDKRGRMIVRVQGEPDFEALRELIERELAKDT